MECAQRIDMWHRDLEAVSQSAIFTAAQKSHTPLDYVYIADEGASVPLSSYKVLIYAHLCIMSEARAALLEEYVKAGGILILGCHSGYKNLDGHRVMQDLPGLLQPLAGVDVPEFTRTCPGDGPVWSLFDEMEVEKEMILGPFGTAVFKSI